MTCSIDGCEKPRFGRGYCQAHYARFKRYGDPLGGVGTTTLAQRFFKRVDGASPPADGSCWEWQGSLSPEGYGRLGTKYAHRISYEIFVGPIPPGASLDHLCRNTRCLNPAHLEPVSHRVNVLRGMSPGAIAVRTNKCKRGHEFTPENTYVRHDGGGRQCKECIRIRRRRRAADIADARDEADKRWLTGVEK